MVRSAVGRNSRTASASSGGTSNMVGDSADGADGGACGDQWQRNGGGTVGGAAAPSLCRVCGSTVAPGSDVGGERRHANPLEAAPPPPTSTVGKYCPPCECTAQHHHRGAAIGYSEIDATCYPSNKTAAAPSLPGNGEKDTTDACSESKIHAAVTTRAPFASITTKAPPSLLSDSSTRVTAGGRRPASTVAAANPPQSATRTARARRMANGLPASPPPVTAGSGLLSPCRRAGIGASGCVVGGVVVSVAAAAGAAAALMATFEKHRVAMCFLR